MTIDILKDSFHQFFGKKNTAQYFFAPGRVNLMGEHTDYNGGYVLPCALQFGTYLAIAPNQDKQIRFVSLNMPQEQQSIDIIHLSNSPIQQHWSNYPLGVFQQFIKKGFNINTGFDLLFYGNLPVGAGLSSSASIELVTAKAIDALLQTQLSTWDLVHIGMQAEHEAVGVKCGILDQFAVAFGKAEHTLLLDCHQLTFEEIPSALSEHIFVLVDSVVPRSLVDSAYNTRYEECQTVLAYFKQTNKDIKHLSTVSLDELSSAKNKLASNLYKRAKHIIRAHQRTPLATQYLRKAQWENFGALMFESHQSLSEDYEVSGQYLDTLIHISKELGSLGARMTGAGFGGCTVHLIHKDAYTEFSTKIAFKYKQLTKLDAKCYPVQISDGVRELC